MKRRIEWYKVKYWDKHYKRMAELYKSLVLLISIFNINDFTINKAIIDISSLLIFASLHQFEST